MRILLLALSLLLAAPVFNPVLAQDQAGTTDEVVEKVRRDAKSALMTARDWAGQALDTTKEWTGLNDDQLLGVGVGAVAGLMAADMIGFGGLFTAAATVGGAYVGKWVADADGVAVAE